MFNCGQSYNHSSRGSIKRHLVACFRTHRPALKRLSDAQVQTLLAGERKPNPLPATPSQHLATGRNRLTPQRSSSGLHRTRRVQHPGAVGSVCAVPDEGSTSERLSGDYIQRLVDEFTPCNIRRTCPLTMEEARVGKPEQRKLGHSVIICDMPVTNDSRVRDVHTKATSRFHVGSASPGVVTSLWHSLNDDQKDENWSLRKSLQAISWTQSSGKAVLDPCISLPQMVRLLLLDTQRALVE
jgi:hypothetical protein